MMEIPLADQLSNVSLVDVVPVESIRRLLFQVFARQQGPVGREDRPRYVDGLQFDRQKLLDLTIYPDIGNYEVHIPEACHLDLRHHRRISWCIANPTVFYDLCEEIDFVEPLGAHEDQFFLRISPWSLSEPERADGIRFPSDLCAALRTARLDEGA